MTQLRKGLRYVEVEYGDISEVVDVTPETHTIRLVSAGSAADDEFAPKAGEETAGIPNFLWEEDFLPRVEAGQFRILEDGNG